MKTTYGTVFDLRRQSKETFKTFALRCVNPDGFEFNELIRLSMSDDSIESECATLLLLILYSEKLLFSYAQYYSTHQEPEVRKRAKLLLLTRFPQELSCRRRINLLLSDDEEIVSAVILLLYESEVEELDYQALLHALRTASPRVYKVLVELLKKLPTSQFDYHVLRTFLKNPSAPVREVAQMLMIEHFPYNMSYTELLECVASPFGFVAKKAEVLSMGFTTLEIIPDTLLPFLKHRNPLVRARTSMLLLYRFPKLAKNRTLLKLSFSSSKAVRTVAVKLLLKRVREKTCSIVNLKKCA